MTLEHATHTTYKITRFDSEEWLNYNKKERSKPLKNEPNCLKPGTRPSSPLWTGCRTFAGSSPRGEYAEGRRQSLSCKCEITPV